MLGTVIEKIKAHDQGQEIGVSALAATRLRRPSRIDEANLRRKLAIRLTISSLLQPYTVV